MQRISVQVSDELYAQLVEFAEAESRSVANAALYLIKVGMLMTIERQPEGE